MAVCATRSTAWPTALHSRPGARRTLYLNFRGAVLTNTVWNDGGGARTALPFDTDGAPYSFSDAELQRIQYIWQRVAEDFAPLDIDVTTEQPAPDRLTYTGSSDAYYGTTALITSRSGVYSCGCGGVAYIGVFDAADKYKPALVFYDALGGSEKNVAEAISHEVGHNLGLQHDGGPGTGYYGGHGSGATGWAPIMGVGYSRALSQWSKGEYAGATNVEDDFAVMQKNGAVLRADDHGSSAGAATPLVPLAGGTTLQFAVQGVIERAGDLDFFAFTAGAGPATFVVTPAARGANLDATIELRNAAGAVLASANPVAAIDASVSAVLPQAGTYYVVVQGSGNGSPSTGYSNYGSLGYYAVAGSATAAAAANAAPTAALTATPISGTAPLVVSFSSAGSADADGTIAAVDWTFGDGASASGATASHTYNAVGSYTAEVRVTDNGGLAATRAVTITVTPAVATPQLAVADIAMQRTGSTKYYQAQATVTVVDAQGRPVSGATVSGRFSGQSTKSTSAVTDSAGKARLKSSASWTRGTFGFTVTAIVRTGHTYEPALNVETSDSIAF